MVPRTATAAANLHWPSGIVETPHMQLDLALDRAIRRNRDPCVWTNLLHCTCHAAVTRSSVNVSAHFRVHSSPESGLQALDSGLPESSSRPLTRRVVYDRIHYLLRHLIYLVPTCPSTLQPLLSRNFPHKRQNHVSQVTYIRNLLRVTEYCPEIADRILALVIDRAIQVDVSGVVFCTHASAHTTTRSRFKWN